jgi:hypothetical protein
MLSRKLVAFQQLFHKLSAGRVDKALAAGFARESVQLMAAGAAGELDLHDGFLVHRERSGEDFLKVAVFSRWTRRQWTASTGSSPALR